MPSVVLMKGTRDAEEIRTMHPERLETGELQKAPPPRTDILRFISTILEGDIQLLHG